MTRQPIIARRAEELLGVAVVATAPVAGGDVATATRLRTALGGVALMKTRPHAPSGFFETEAAGLRWLAEASASGGVAVPELLGAADDCVILRWIEPGRPSADAADAFGRALAATHAAGAPAFGWHHDGYIASLPLPNRPLPTWAEFYAERRVLPYLRLARERDLVSIGQQTVIERTVARLPELLPEEPPARVHGDLWNGNVLWGPDGVAYIVDPAAHGGHRELDLAMLTLFGLPHLGRALAAYDDAAPLAPGWEERLALHQLHPLLVHACLFGGGYAARAVECAARFR